MGRQPTSPPEERRNQALDCIPVRNPEVRAEATGQGLLLSYPVEVRPWFRGILRHVTGNPGIVTRKLQLDSLGSSVWEMIDDRRSVRQLAARFQERYQVGRREAELSVTAFLRELGKRGLVAMKEKPGNQATPRQT